MLPHLKDYFHYTKRERRGIFVLMLILSLQLIYLSIDQEIYSYFRTDTEYSREEFEKLAAKLKSVEEESENPDIKNVEFDSEEEDKEAF